MFKKFIILGGDTLGLYLALFLALTIRYQKNPWPETWASHWPTFSLIFFLWLVIFYLTGLYDLRKAKNDLQFFSSFLVGLGINLLLAIGYFYIVNLPNLSPKTILLLLISIYLPLFALWRLLAHFLLRSSTFGARLLFLGLTKEARELISIFSKNPQLGYNAIAVLSEEQNRFLNEIPLAVEKLSGFDGLLDYIKTKKVDTIILSLSNTDTGLNRLLYEIILSRVNIANINSFYETITHRVPLAALSETWFLENLKETRKNVYDKIKLATDFVLAVIMLISFLILLPILALIIYLGDRGSIFYRQTRVGRDGKIFTIWKFRTMKVGAENNGPQFAAVDDNRVTTVGKILRLLRLDELPQAINILKNEMSFIGPRPERPEFVSELQKLMPYYNARHLIKPGLTGWAQVNYNYTDSFEGNLMKLQFDLFYIKNRSILVDAITLLKTIKLIGAGR
jgi:exopolysaccharide biosynthesis polyprenyl glycosylphosphotransferase